MHNRYEEEKNKDNGNDDSSPVVTRPAEHQTIQGALNVWHLKNVVTWAVAGGRKVE